MTDSNNVILLTNDELVIANPQFLFRFRGGEGIIGTTEKITCETVFVFSRGKNLRNFILGFNDSLTFVW